MKRFSIPLLLVFLTTAICAGEPSRQSEADAAQAAIKMFAGALQTELKSAMQAGGPVEAIRVCNTRATQISELISAEQGMHLGRVSLKNRNPGNAPNDWQKAVLNQFERELAGGQDVGGLAWSEIAETGAGREFRFMKAIPTGGLCLVCHGGSISPEVQQKLAELYPEDKATGFREGDIRGAFVVTRRLGD